jgi:hypothetical protein
VVGPGGQPISFAQAGGGTIGSDAFYSIGSQEDGVVHLIGGLSTPGQGPTPASLSHPANTSVLYSGDSGLTWKVQNFSNTASSFLNVLVPHANGTLSTMGGIDVFPGNPYPQDTTRAWYAPGSSRYRVTPNGELTAEVSNRSIWIRGLPFQLNTGFRHNIPLLYRAVLLPDGSWLGTAAVFWSGIPARSTPPEAKGWIPGSVICLRSKDAHEWIYTGLIANASEWQLQYSTFGPTENDLVLLKDNKTLMAVLRMDGDSGCGPTYKNYHSSISTDLGRTFTRPTPIPDVGCVRPKLLVFLDGPLVLSGGRLCTHNTVDILMWVNWAGDGSTGLPHVWEKFSLTSWHNRNAPASFNATFRFDASVNSTSHFETLAYTSLVRTGPRSGLVFYQKFLNGAPGQWPPWPSLNFMMPFQFKTDDADRHAIGTKSELRDRLVRDLHLAMQHGLVDADLATQTLENLQDDETNATTGRSATSAYSQAADQELPLLFMSTTDLSDSWGLQHPVANPVNDVNELGANCSTGDFPVPRFMDGRLIFGGVMSPNPLRPEAGMEIFYTGATVDCAPVVNNSRAVTTICYVSSHDLCTFTKPVPAAALNRGLKAAGCIVKSIARTSDGRQYTAFTFCSHDDGVRPIVATTPWVPHSFSPQQEQPAFRDHDSENVVHCEPSSESLKPSQWLDLQISFQPLAHGLPKRYCDK